jgi:hypothetical protein
VSVWYVTPSCRPKEEALPCFEAWLDMGYRVMVIRQGPKLPSQAITQISTQTYMGLPSSVNLLSRWVLAWDPKVDWIVHGGDDYWPDPKHRASWISDLCWNLCNSSFCVMQPTGDRFGGGYIDKAAASAWMGREWCRRMYRGEGPMHQGYFHYFADTELQDLATKLGVFYQRRDIIQEHKHWTREAAAKMPRHLEIPNQHLTRDETLYRLRRDSNFPNHQPID